jgi:glycosyltransferase involved in cell wall biosynthesis
MITTKPDREDSTPKGSAGVCSSRRDVALLFVGAIVPEKPAFQTAAFSRAGQIYQREMLEGLRRAGLPTSEIVSIIPIPSYPRSDRLWIGACREEIIEDTEVRLLPFLNVSPVKQIMIGFMTIIELIRWGWRNRRAPSLVVFTYNLTVPPGLFTLVGAKLIGAKAVAALCDIDVPGQTVPFSLPWRLNYWIQRKLIPHFDGHVVAADAIADDFLGNRQYVRVEGGIAEQQVSSTRDPITPERPPNPSFTVGFAGRVDETNGIPALLEAFSLLEGDQYRLCVAGAGPLAQQVKDAASKDSRIEYKGLIPLDQVRALYSSSDVLINMRMTGHRNTRYFFPSKMIEYLASGTPVISTCTGHIEKEFGEFVFLLRDETPKGLAAAIWQAARLDPEVRGQTGQRAQKYMTTHKTWNSQSKRVAQYILEVVLEINAKPSVYCDRLQVLRAEPQVSPSAMGSPTVTNGEGSATK